MNASHPGSYLFKKKIVDCYQRYFSDSLVALVLCGSRARGDAHKISDYDLLLICEDLPKKQFRRLMKVRKPMTGKFCEKVNILSKTPVEFDGQFPSLYLDIGLDGEILYDRDHYMSQRLKKIKKIIQDAGLSRERQGRYFEWKWRAPVRPGWSLDWNGLHGL